MTDRSTSTRPLCWFYVHDSCVNRNCPFEHSKDKSRLRINRTVLSSSGWNPELVTQVSAESSVKILKFGPQFVVTDQLLSFLASTPNFANNLETFEAGSRGTTSQVTDESLEGLLKQTPKLRTLHLVDFKQLTDATFSNIIRHCPLIEEIGLVVSSNGLLTNKTFSLLLEKARNEPGTRRNQVPWVCNHLTHIDVRGHPSLDIDDICAFTAERNTSCSVVISGKKPDSFLSVKNGMVLPVYRFHDHGTDESGYTPASFGSPNRGEKHARSSAGGYDPDFSESDSAEDEDDPVASAFLSPNTTVKITQHTENSSRSGYHPFRVNNNNSPSPSNNRNNNGFGNSNSSSNGFGSGFGNNNDNNNNSGNNKSNGNTSERIDTSNISLVPTYDKGHYPWGQWERGEVNNNAWQGGNWTGGSFGDRGGGKGVLLGGPPSSTQKPVDESPFIEEARSKLTYNRPYAIVKLCVPRSILHDAHEVEVVQLRMPGQFTCRSGELTWGKVETILSLPHPVKYPHDTAKGPGGPAGFNFRCAAKPGVWIVEKYGVTYGDYSQNSWVNNRGIKKNVKEIRGYLIKHEAVEGKGLVRRMLAESDDNFKEVKNNRRFNAEEEEEEEGNGIVELNRYDWNWVNGKEWYFERMNWAESRKMAVIDSDNWGEFVKGCSEKGSDVLVGVKEGRGEEKQWGFKKKRGDENFGVFLYGGNVGGGRRGWLLFSGAKSGVFPKSDELVGIMLDMSADEGN
eukprot:TRINITY_DN1793_c0_g1_i1.p1 TRINITY_DN1793_c0_g1~~TRINITY_DN1793_c0_g1_i1.p1  ORF type:complete len:737 (-),score=215.05 TRINITY_DN1793_c0_g1_i1:62-2272(-)